MYVSGGSMTCESAEMIGLRVMVSMREVYHGMSLSKVEKTGSLSGVLTFEEIARRYEHEVRGRRPLATSDVLPIAYEEITPAWMTSALAGRFPGAEVVGVRVGERDEGTSSRRRIFLTW